MVTDGSGISSGHLYIAAVNTRCNLLLTRSHGGCGQSWSGNVRTCDACRLCQLETLSHISQVCPRTWSPRNWRHNKLVDILSRFLQRRGFTTLLERKFYSLKGNFKLDIIAWNDHQALVIDVTVTSDNLLNAKGSVRSIQPWGKSHSSSERQQDWSRSLAPWQ